MVRVECYPNLERRHVVHRLQPCADAPQTLVQHSTRLWQPLRCSKGSDDRAMGWQRPRTLRGRRPRRRQICPKLLERGMPARLGCSLPRAPPSPLRCSRGARNCHHCRRHWHQRCRRRRASAGQPHGRRRCRPGVTAARDARRTHARDTGRRCSTNSCEPRGGISPCPAQGIQPLLVGQIALKFSWWRLAELTQPSDVVIIVVVVIVRGASCGAAGVWSSGHHGVAMGAPVVGIDADVHHE